MSLILLFLCNLILFHGCLTANIDREWSHNGVEQLNKSESGNQVDLQDEDFNYPMFDNADLPQIVKFAKNPRVSDLLRKLIFPVKYHNYQFNLISLIDEDGPGQIYEFENIFDIRSYQLFLDLIKYFGESIRKLRLLDENLVGDDRSIVLHKYINLHCSDSLIELDLASIEVSTWAQFKKPFSKVEELLIYVGTNEVGTIDSINKIFPKLRRLFLSYSDIEPDNVVNASRLIESEVPHMEHLERLDVYFTVYNGLHFETVHNQLERLFQKNPQIRNLIYGCTYACHGRNLIGNFIQVINKYLPNLENLQISDLDLDIEAVHMNHVKHFKVTSIADGPFEKLSFSQLESLDMNFFWAVEPDSREYHSWIMFFKNHQDLKKLNIQLCNGYDGLVEFLAELPNLEELRINSSDLIENHLKTIELFSQLVGNYKHLLKFQYQIEGYSWRDQSQFNQLATCRERFGNEWNITHHIENERWPTLTLERKV